jgi:pyruvate formate lyase activating enzyme
LRCLYCQNPDTQDFDGGNEMTVPELMRIIERMRPYFGKDGGVTLSGGEPLAQPAGASELLRACRAARIHTAVDTGGGCASHAALAAARLADLLLLDIKHPDPAKCRELTGADLDAAVALLRAAEEHRQAVWIRHVVVPGWSDTRETMDALAEFLAPFTCIQRLDLLPYHTLGAPKYRALGRPLPLPATPAADPATVRQLEQYLRERRR